MLDSLSVGDKVIGGLQSIKGECLFQYNWIPGHRFAELLNCTLSYLKMHSLHFFFTLKQIYSSTTLPTQNPQSLQMFMYELLSQTPVFAFGCIGIKA